MKLSRVGCCLRLPANSAGRDFVVGDLHGRLGAFERSLEELSFDPRKDRVISVGDLVNRGPHSLETLGLIEEPWFHAVLGNHELMVLNYLGFFRSRLYDRQTYAAKKGVWLIQALHSHRRRVLRLAEQLAELPLVIDVDEPEPFRVMHGDLQPLGSRLTQLILEETIDVHLAERLTSSRSPLSEVLVSDLRTLVYNDHLVNVCSVPKGRQPLTYVGHSPMPRITVHHSHVYIDQSARQTQDRLGGICSPTVVNHRQFSLWLDGVAAAHRVPAAKVSGKPAKFHAASAVAA